MNKAENEERKRHAVYVTIATLATIGIILLMTNYSGPEADFFENPPKVLQYCGDSVCQDIVRDEVPLRSTDTLKNGESEIRFLGISGEKIHFEVSMNGNDKSVVLKEGQGYNHEGSILIEIDDIFDEKGFEDDVIILMIRFNENVNLCPSDCDN